MPEFDHLKLQVEDGVALLTLNRPDALNALNRALLAELASAFAGLESDDDVGGVIVTGSGDKAFSAGADIRELDGLDPLDAVSRARKGQGLLDRIEHFRKPVVAAVNGLCLGGGCELAMACHLRLASENARFGQPEVKLGLIPGFGGSQRLPRLVGRSIALELLLTGRMIGAEEASRIGLVNNVVAAEELLDASRKLLGAILKRGPLAVRYVLESVHAGLQMPIREAQSLEATLFGLCFATEDAQEGVQAFLEKRPPAFQGK